VLACAVDTFMQQFGELLRNQVARSQLKVMRPVSGREHLGDRQGSSR
jgi:hypothetical protein